MVTAEVSRRLVNAAVSRQLRRDALNELLAAMRDEQGPVPERVTEEVRRQWPAPDETSR